MSELGGSGDDDNSGDGGFKFPQSQTPASPVDSTVSVHEQDDPEAFAQVGPPPAWTTFYCFTDYIEAIPLTGAVAGGDLDGNTLEDFPESRAAADYATLYCLDCIDAGHVNTVANKTTFVALKHNFLTQAEIDARKAVLANLLNDDHMKTIYLIVGPDAADADAFHEDLGQNGWAKIEVQMPEDFDNPPSIDDTIGANLNTDVVHYVIAQNSTTGGGVDAAGRLPDVKLTDEERAWLEEFVSFNHIPDIGSGGPGPEDGPQTPPVPIFPASSLEDETLNNDLADPLVLAHLTPDDDAFTEEFERNQDRHWVHRATGLFTIEHGNCWVLAADNDYEFYRLYADDVNNPNRVLFFKLKNDVLVHEVPPQAPGFAMRAGIDRQYDVQPWDVNSIPLVAVF